MPTAFKNFNVDRAPLRKDEVGPTFELGPYTFECKPRLPAIASQQLTQMGKIGGDMVALPNVIEMIRDSLLTRKWAPEPTEEDPEAGDWKPTQHVANFDALLNDPDELIESETLGSIVQWLMEEYGGRPTRRSARS